jgi:hypothetical protein
MAATAMSALMVDGKWDGCVDGCEERTKKKMGGKLSRVVGWPNLVSTEEE